MRCAACGRRINEWRDKLGRPDPRGVCECPEGALVHGLADAEVAVIEQRREAAASEPRERKPREPLDPVLRTVERVVHGQTVAVKVIRPHAALHYGPGNMRRWIRWERRLTSRDDPERAGQVIRAE